MRTTLIAAAFLLILSWPTQAQTMGTAAAGSSGGSGRSVSSASVPSFSGGSPAHVAPAHFSMAAASGTDEEYSPSVFMLFGDALGKASFPRRPRTKSMAEVARETRMDPKLLTKVVFTQNSSGEIVAVGRH